jgi:hypothetical protein
MISWDTSEYAFTTCDSPLSRSAWLADSGTTSHVVPDRSLFESYTPTPGARMQGTAGDAEISGCGIVRAIIRNGAASHTLTLCDVAHVPSCPANLLSIAAIDRAGGSATFKSGTVLIRTPDGKLLGRGNSVTGHSGLYKLRMEALWPRVQASGTHERNFYSSDVQRTSIEPAPSLLSPSLHTPSIPLSPSTHSAPAAASTRTSSCRAQSGAALIFPATVFAEGEDQRAPRTHRTAHVPQAHTSPHPLVPSAHALVCPSSAASSDSVSPPSAPTAAPRACAIPRAPSVSQSSPQASRASPVAPSRAIAAREHPTVYHVAMPPLFAPVRSPSTASALSGALQPARASPLASPVLAGSLHADCDAGSLAAPISRAEGENEHDQCSKITCGVPASPPSPFVTSRASRSAPMVPSVDPTTLPAPESERPHLMRLASLPHSLPSSRASSPADSTSSVDLFLFGQHSRDDTTATHRGLRQQDNSEQSECDRMVSAPIAAVPLPADTETDPELVQPSSEAFRRPKLPSFVPNRARARTTQVPRRLTSPTRPVDAGRLRQRFPAVSTQFTSSKHDICAQQAHSEPDSDDHASECSCASNFSPSESRSTPADHVRLPTTLYPSYFACM